MVSVPGELPGATLPPKFRTLPPMKPVPPRVPPGFTKVKGLVVVPSTKSVPPLIVVLPW